MKEIKPTYVTFEQAKWLKEKGFDEVCNAYFNLDKEIVRFEDSHFSPSCNSDMHPYTYGEITLPEQWQVCEWLRVNHGIWIYILPYSTLFRPYVEEIIDKDRFGKWEGHKYNSPQEAYSAAFNYILKELI
jgi:hypothetical protein